MKAKARDTYFAWLFFSFHSSLVIAEFVDGMFYFVSFVLKLFDGVESCESRDTVLVVVSLMTHTLSHLKFKLYPC